MLHKNSDIGIDLGNSKFSLCARGEGVVACESAYLAYRGDTPTPASVVAFGDEARQMFGRSHPGIHVVTPMREGVIVDCSTASVILNLMARKAGLRWRLSRPRALVGSLFGASDVERKAFADVADSLGCRQVHVVNEPLAAANGIGVEVSSPEGNMVIDIGDGATEVIVVSLGQAVFGSSMRFGGSDMDQLVMNFMRRRHNMVISSLQAAKVKETLSKNPNWMNSGDTVTVKGMGLPDFLPRDAQVPQKDFFPVFRHVAGTITDFVLSAVSKVPPEVSVDLIRNGIHLCGGSSQTALVADAISRATSLQVKVSDEPGQTVVRGLYRMLDYARRYA